MYIVVLEIIQPLIIKLNNCISEQSLILIYIPSDCEL